MVFRQDLEPVEPYHLPHYRRYNWDYYYDGN